MKLTFFIIFCVIVCQNVDLISDICTHTHARTHYVFMNWYISKDISNHNARWNTQEAWIQLYKRFQFILFRWSERFRVLHGYTNLYSKKDQDYKVFLSINSWFYDFDCPGFSSFLLRINCLYALDWPGGIWPPCMVTDRWFKSALN